MGNCVSSQDREAQLRSQEIDKQIEEDSRKFKKECKILLLGECFSIHARWQPAEVAAWEKVGGRVRSEGGDRTRHDRAMSRSGRVYTVCD